MMTVECPWCDGPMAVVESTDAATCVACGIDEVLAPAPAADAEALAA